MISRRWIAFLPICIFFTGCDTVKDEMGLTRRTPDEFAVMTRAPLEMPPASETALPVPRLGAPRPQEVSPVQSAQTALWGQPLPSADQESAAENALLMRAGADQADPNIRSRINEEAAKSTNKNKPVIKKILSIGRKTEPDAAIVDAPAELQRIKTNQDSGKPITSGETPSLED